MIKNMFWSTYFIFNRYITTKEWQEEWGGKRGISKILHIKYFLWFRLSYGIGNLSEADKEAITFLYSCLYLNFIELNFVVWYPPFYECCSIDVHVLFKNSAFKVQTFLLKKNNVKAIPAFSQNKLKCFTNLASYLVWLKLNYQINFKLNC